MGDAQRQIQRVRENHNVFVFLKMCPWEDALKRLVWSRGQLWLLCVIVLANIPATEGGLKCPQWVFAFTAGRRTVDCSAGRC